MKTFTYFLILSLSLTACFSYDDSVPVMDEQTLEDFYVRGNINGQGIDANLNLYQLLFLTNDNAFGDRRFIWSQYLFRDRDNVVIQELNDATDERFLSQVEVQFIENQGFQPEEWLNTPLFTRTDSSGSEPVGLCTIILKTDSAHLVMKNEYVGNSESKTVITEVSDGEYIDNPLLKVITLSMNDEFRIFKDDMWTGETVKLEDVEARVVMKIRNN